MSKIIAIVGLLVGVIGIGAAAYVFLLGGMSGTAAHAEPEAVHVPGKLGPHLVFKERVFNLGWNN